jgi:hypothetical protein
MMTLRINRTTTSNLDLAAYLMLRGCRLEGIEKTSQFRSMFIITGENVPELVNEFASYTPVEFSPKAFMDVRSAIKRMAMEEDVDRVNYIKNLTAKKGEEPGTQLTEEELSEIDSESLPL